MVQTLIVLAALLVVWAAFGLLSAVVRRRKLRGEHPGVGERPPAVAHTNEQTSGQSWRDGRRPWH